MKDLHTEAGHLTFDYWTIDQDSAALDKFCKALINEAKKDAIFLKKAELI